MKRFHLFWGWFINLQVHRKNLNEILSSLHSPVFCLGAACPFWDLPRFRLFAMVYLYVKIFENLPYVLPYRCSIQHPDPMPAALQAALTSALGSVKMSGLDFCLGSPFCANMVQMVLLKMSRQESITLLVCSGQRRRHSPACHVLDGSSCCQYSYNTLNRLRMEMCILNGRNL